MTPIDYAAQIIVPTATDAMENPTDRRLAYLTCIAVYHLVDYLALASIAEITSNRERKAKHKKAATEIKARVAAQCPSEFKVVGDICNGFKHPERANRPAESVIEIPGFGPGMLGSVFYAGPAKGPSLAVQVEGELLFLDGCIMAVLVALRDLYPEMLMAPAVLEKWRSDNANTVRDAEASEHVSAKL